MCERRFSHGLHGLLALCVASLLATNTAIGQTGAAWSNFGNDARHTGISATPSQVLGGILWQTPVDQQPQYTGNFLLIHYGSPLVTAANTVVFPVKTGASGGFRVEARAAVNGTLLWNLPSDYVLPSHSWTPPFGPALAPGPRVYYPGIGGTVLYRDQPDSGTGAEGRIAFYGLANYQADPQSYNANVTINTPITSDSAGNIYFGFLVTGETPLQLQSGIARIDANGAGQWDFGRRRGRRRGNDAGCLQLRPGVEPRHGHALCRGEQRLGGLSCCPRQHDSCAAGACPLEGPCVRDGRVSLRQQQCFADRGQRR